MPETLDDLEKRVTERLLEKVAEQWPLPDDPFESVEFSPDRTELLNPVSAQGKTVEISTVCQPLPPPLQFPPER